MTEIISAWSVLDSRRKFIVGLAAVLALVAMGAIWRLAAQEDFSLLYAGLEPSAAGDVIAALEQRGVAYEVRGNAIHVVASERDSVRLSLASEGLPATGGVGYELLDTMSGFGTTAQMFDAAYWRAKEGELAQTILASREIRSARVHIATPPRQPFSRSVPFTASVTVTPAGGAVSQQQAEAIRFLVSSAVAGLKTGDVAVIDSANGVILSPGDTPGTAPDPAAVDPRAAQIKAQLERLLAARVGAGKAVVEVSIDADMDSQTITERVIDPTSRVAISTDLEENTETASGGAGPGAVTVASNLPAGDAEADGAGGSSNRSETRERQNFEISETRRERVIQPGQIRRISVAVILDGITAVADDGSRSWSARPEDEMAALRDLVESAIGFDPARGDRVTLQTLEFPAAPALGTEAVGSSFSIFEGGVLRLIQSAVLGLVALLLGLFVVRPLLMRPPALPAPEILAGSLDLSGEGGALDGSAEAQQQVIPDPGQNKIRNLRALVEDRRDDSAEVLRRWIDASERSESKT